MKKIALIASFTALLFACNKTNQVNPIEDISKPTSVLTEDGIKNITYNERGNPILTFTLSEFKKNLKEAEKINANSSNNVVSVLDEDDDDGFDNGDSYSIGIRIATRKSKCLSGVGFRCGIVSNVSDLTTTSLSNSNSSQGSSTNGIKADRIYNAIARAENNIVTLTFTEDVNWNWLANN